MLAVVVIIFVVCYVPYTTFFLVVEHYQEALQWRYLKILYYYIYLLMWFPNALNPLCYGALDEHYAAIIKSLCCCAIKKTRTRYFRSGNHAGNSIPGNSNHNGNLFSRSNNSIPPVIEKSRSQTVSHSSPDEGRKRSKICCC